MIAFILILLLASDALAQKTCTPAGLTQNCVVTITIETKGNPNDFTIQRQDGNQPIKERTVIARVVTDTFSDPGNTAHAYTVVANYADGTKVKSNTDSWITPPLAAPYPTVPPLTSLSQQVNPIVWTLGAPSKQYPGNYDILRNGQTVQNARGSQIALCNGVIFVLGRDKLWWRFNVNSWQATGQATLVCNVP